MTYSFDGLMSQAEKIFAQNPLSGHLFLFLNRGAIASRSCFGIRMAFAFGTNAWRLERFELLQALPRTSRASNWTSANCTGCSVASI